MEDVDPPMEASTEHLFNAAVDDIVRAASRRGVLTMLENAIDYLETKGYPEAADALASQFGPKQ